MSNTKIHGLTSDQKRCLWYKIQKNFDTNCFNEQRPSTTDFEYSLDIGSPSRRKSWKIEDPPGQHHIYQTWLHMWINRDNRSQWGELVFWILSKSQIEEIPPLNLIWEFQRKLHRVVPYRIDKKRSDAKIPFQIKNCNCICISNHANLFSFILHKEKKDIRWRVT